MARRSEGWSLKRDRRTGNWLVTFTHPKRGGQCTRSTRTGDAREAKRVAAQIYEDELGGRQRPKPGQRLDLEGLVAEWLVTVEKEVRPDTLKCWQLYARTHWLPHFGDRVDDASIRDYVRSRLSHVTGSTVKKELSALRRFLRWSVEEGAVVGMPEIPVIRKGTSGTKDPRGDKVRVDFDPETAWRVINALPIRSARARYPVRAFFAVMWETSLRRGTLWRLEAPRDYRRGDGEVTIRPEADKSGYGRTVPLTDVARAALDSCCPAQGPIFPPADLRVVLRAAALAAGLPEERAGRLSHHDFRHARITDWANRSKGLTGPGYLAGHKHATTTAMYVHAKRREAEGLLGND